VRGGDRRRSAVSPVLWYADAEAAFGTEWANLIDAANPTITAADSGDLADDAHEHRHDGQGERRGLLQADREQRRRRHFYSPGSRRTEVATANPVRSTFPVFKRGNERWIAWQVRLDTNYPSTPGTFNLATNGGFPVNFNSITQIKQLGTLGSPIHSSPCRTTISTRRRTSNDPTSEYPSYSLASYFYDLGPVVKNTWMKMMLHCYFDSTAANGMVEWFGDLGDGNGYRQLLAPTYQATQKISDGSDGLGDRGRPATAISAPGSTRRPRSCWARPRSCGSTVSASRRPAPRRRRRSHDPFRFA
jgi:hypothetical protein